VTTFMRVLGNVTLELLISALIYKVRLIQISWTSTKVYEPNSFISHCCKN